MTRILITRPQPEAQTTAEALHQAGYQTTIEPLLTYVPVPAALPPADQIGGLIITSTAALTQGNAPLDRYKDLPIFCVGNKTANQAHSHGFTTIHDASGTAIDLATLIQSVHAKQAFTMPLLYLRGQDISQPLTAWLTDQNIPAIEAIIYQAKAEIALSQGVCNAIKNQQIDVALFYSARSAKLFTKLIRKHGLTPYLSHIKALSISNSVLGYIDDLNWNDTLCAATPDQQAMLTKLQQSVP